MTGTRTLADLREHSERAWETCVDTCYSDPRGTIDGPRQAKCRLAAESAMDAWDRAIAAAGEQDYDTARAALREARTLAAEWGDDSDEREALELLDGLEREGGRMTGRTYASIYTVDGSGELSVGLQTCHVCDEAIRCAEETADEIGEDVLLFDGDGDWIVHPRREDGTREPADPAPADEGDA